MKDKEIINEIKQDFKTHEEKHKQIEEMAKMIENILNRKMVIGNLSQFIAVELSKYYQPKIDKDSVVLTEREHEIAMIHQYDVGFAFGYEKGSKETAEKILKTLMKEAEYYYLADYNDCMHDEPFIEKQDLLIIINEIAKQFGVEIKE